MMMRVKPVIISSAAGRNDNEVISSMVCMLSEYVSEPFGPGVAVRAGRVAWATTPAGNSASQQRRGAEHGQHAAPAREEVMRLRKFMRVAG